VPKPLTLLAAAAVVVLGSACNDRVGVDLPDAPTGAPTTVPTEIATEIPTDVPTGAGTFSSGEAEVTLSGAVEDTLQLSVSEQIPTTYVFGVLTSTWGEPGANLLSINGTASEGRNRTGPAFGLTITLTDGRSFASSGNECFVDLSAAGESGIEGDFDCTGLSSSTGAVDAAGTFEATP
jgi:hypothetical protein